MSDFIAELKGVSKYYLLGETKISALHEIDYSCRTGDFIVIAGPSGSGKSTLLNILGCIDKPSQGSVILEDEDTTSLSFEQLTSIRRNKLGFIFQNFNLVPVLTAYENVELPLLFRDLPATEIESRVTHVLDRVGLGNRANHLPAKLSGGQRQRVAIARALAGNPRIMLADEPTANLDSKTAEEIINLLVDLNQKEHCTIVVATHDPAIVRKAQTVLTIQDGKIVNHETKTFL